MSAGPPDEPACAAAGVRFGVGLSPFELYRSFDDAAKADLARKLADLEAAGVTPVLEQLPMADDGVTGTGTCYVLVTPDGSTALVADFQTSTVTPIRLATRTPGPAIAVAGSTIAFSCSS